MIRTAPWSKRRFFLHSATKALERLAYFVAFLLAVAVNVPVIAVALRGAGRCETLSAVQYAILAEPAAQRIPMNF